MSMENTLVNLWKKVSIWNFRFYYEWWRFYYERLRYIIRSQDFITNVRDILWEVEIL